MKKVDNAIYLGAVIEINCDAIIEIKSRIAKATGTAQSMNVVWNKTFCPKIKAVICIKNFGFALRLRTFVQKFLT